MTINIYGATPLHLVMMYKHTDLAKALIDSGAETRRAHPSIKGTGTRLTSTV